jgi:hypothetical protein
MIALYCEDPRDLAQAVAAIPSDLVPRQTSGWTYFEQIAREADCAVAIFQEDEGTSPLERLRALTAIKPRVPFVAVIRPEDLTSARELTLDPDAFLTRGRVGEALWPAARRAIITGALANAGAAMGTSRLLSPLMRAALREILGAPDTPRSPSALAASINSDVSSLLAAWSDEVGVRCSFTLTDVGEWVLLLRTLAAKREGRQWSDVATLMGVHVQHLNQTSRALTGRTLNELAFRGRQIALERFLDRVVAPILMVTPVERPSEGEEMESRDAAG